MKKKITCYILTLFFFCISCNLRAEYGDMNPGTCAPSGVINKTKAKIDPKGFWIKMVVDSQQGIDTLTGKSTDADWSGPQDHCLINNKINSIGYQQCMSELRSTLDYWIRCHSHAVRMCILNGGLCS